MNLDSRKVVAVLLITIFLTSTGAALTINIDLFNLGGGGNKQKKTNKSTNSTNGSNDKRFTYGGSKSDQITDKKGVKKGLLETVVGSVVNFLFS
ncbi:MAG: hypothetical protein ABEJ87_01305 [Candidatus Nanohalobium sp.]